MEINVDELKRIKDKIDSQYSTLEETQLNLFNCVSNICGFDWIDTNSQRFMECIDSEKMEKDSYQNYIKDRIKVIEIIIEKYSKIGNQIKIELESKNNIILAIDNCISKSKQINTKLASMNLSLSIREFQQLKSMKKSLKKVENKIIKIKSDVNYLYLMVEKAENEISSLISNLLDYIKKQFDYNSRTSTITRNKGTINEALFIKDLEKLSMYIKEENKILKDIYNSFNSTSQYYKSKIFKSYFSAIKEYEKSIEAILSKRNIYIIELKKVISYYKETALSVKKIFEEN